MTTNLRSGLMLALFAVGCTRSFEGAPLRVSNAPTCASGHRLAKQMVLRVERSATEYVQGPAEVEASASKAWLGKRVVVKVGLCALDERCEAPGWAATAETTVGGNEAGLVVEMPKVQVRCDDGALAVQP